LAQGIDVRDRQHNQRLNPTASFTERFGRAGHSASFPPEAAGGCRGRLGFVVLDERGGLAACRYADRAFFRLEAGLSGIFPEIACLFYYSVTD